MVSSPTPLPADALTAWALLRQPWLSRVLALLRTGAALPGCLLRAGCVPAGAALQPQSDVMLMEIFMDVPPTDAMPDFP